MDKASIEKELKTLISSKLRKIKAQSGSSLEKMAEEIGIDYVSLYNIYKGVHLPRMVTLFQISETYAIPLEFWFKDAEKLAARKDAARRRERSDFVRLFDRLDAKNKRVMLRILRYYLKRQRDCGLVSVFFAPNSRSLGATE